MAMTACRECEAEVSTEASACPACGTRTPTMQAHQRRQWRILAAWVTVAVAVGLIGLVLVAANRTGESRDDLDAACDRLMRSVEGIPESLWDAATRDAVRECR